MESYQTDTHVITCINMTQNLDGFMRILLIVDFKNVNFKSKLCKRDYFIYEHNFSWLSKL